VSALIKRQIKAAEYRDRASEASGLAQSSPLAHVREKHQTAAVRWNELAALNEHEGDDSPPEVRPADPMITTGD
jgi:hypothetical protein